MNFEVNVQLPISQFAWLHTHRHTHVVKQVLPTATSTMERRKDILNARMILIRSKVVQLRKQKELDKTDTIGRHVGMVLKVM